MGLRKKLTTYSVLHPNTGGPTNGIKRIKQARLLVSKLLKEGETQIIVDREVQTNNCSSITRIFRSTGYCDFDQLH